MATPSEFAAEALVQAYLNGRTMPKFLHDAVVWVAEKRLASGKTPVLDDVLRTDIDHQATGTRQGLQSGYGSAPHAPIAASRQGRPAEPATLDA